MKAGLNYNSIDEVKIDGKETWNKSLGYHAGLTYQVKIPLIGLGIQPELLYVRNKNESAENVGQSMTLDYLLLPVNVQLGLDLILFRPFIMAGPYLSYAVGKGEQLANTDWKDLNRVDYGYTLGAGIDFWKLQLSGRYVKGMGKISDAEGIPSIEGLKGATNGGFHISLALLF